MVDVSTTPVPDAQLLDFGRNLIRRSGRVLSSPNQQTAQPVNKVGPLRRRSGRLAIPASVGTNPFGLVGRLHHSEAASMMSDPLTTSAIAVGGHRRDVSKGPYDLAAHHFGGDRVLARRADPDERVNFRAVGHQ